MAEVTKEEYEELIKRNNRPYRVFLGTNFAVFVIAFVSMMFTLDANPVASVFYRPGWTYLFGMIILGCGYYVGSEFDLLGCCLSFGLSAFLTAFCISPSYHGMPCDSFVTPVCTDPSEKKAHSTIGAIMAITVAFQLATLCCYVVYCCLNGGSCVQIWPNVKQESILHTKPKKSPGKPAVVKYNTEAATVELSTLETPRKRPIASGDNSTTTTSTATMSTATTKTKKQYKKR